MWDTGASYGARLQELKYLVSRGRTGRLTRTFCRNFARSVGADTDLASGIPTRVLAIHGALTIFIPYLHTRIRAHALSKAWPDAPSSDRRRKAWEILTGVESTHALFSLLSFVTFLWDGRCVIRDP